MIENLNQILCLPNGFHNTSLLGKMSMVKTGHSQVFTFLMHLRYFEAQFCHGFNITTYHRD